MFRNLALAIAIAGAVVLAWFSVQTPKPLPPDAPASDFSAGRAMVDDRVIARIPHPIGSPANAAVRDYLMVRMKALGLEPRVRRLEAFHRFERSTEPFAAGGTVENVVGVLPGQDRTKPAIALMAHYDSVPGSPGAADDAAGVSAALEVVRALKLAGQPKRDVIVLITDGEEAGLLGATAFFKGDPLAKHVGFVINMESRGGGGKAQMFQTAADNGQVVDLFRRTAERPEASSLLEFVYEHMPNDTDFTVSKAAGPIGLNFAFIGLQFDYHSPSSTSDALDQGSLQHMGDQVLPATQAIAFADSLPGPAPNAVYANLPGGYLLSYPPAEGWLVLLAAALLVGVGAWRAQRRSKFAWSDVARGVGAAVYMALTAAALFHLARKATGAGVGFVEQRQLLAQTGRWEFALLLIGTGVTIYAIAAAGRGTSRINAALLAAIAGGCASLFGLDVPALVMGGVAAVIALFAFGKPAGVAGAWLGPILVTLVAATAAQALAPQTAFLLAWPLALAGLGAAISALGSDRSPWSAVPLAIIALAGGGWILGFANGLFQGLDVPDLLAISVWLGALLVWPLAHNEPDRDAGWVTPRNAALAIVVLGFGVTALVRFVPPWSERHPEATSVSYALDADSGKAMRVSSEPALTSWTRAVLKTDGGAIGKASLPVLSRRPLWSAPAKPISAAGPEATIAAGPDGTQVLTVTPPPGARTLSIDLKADTVLLAPTVDGRPFRLFDKPGQWSHLRLSAMPSGLKIAFRPAGPGEIEVRYAAETDSWPLDAKPLPPRDSKTMAFGDSDSTLVYGSRRFTWTTAEAR